MIDEQDPKPTQGEKIRCDCHSKGCHTYARVGTIGTMVGLYLGPTIDNKELHIVLNGTTAMDLALIIAEAIADARAAV